MPETFLGLSASDRREALGVAAGASGRPVHLLEKDVWVVWALNVMFTAPFGSHLVFKGGTSLSKAYAAIRRFSEDVDLTYDIRAFVPALAASDPIPKSKSAVKKWKEVIDERLTEWAATDALGEIERALLEQKLPAKAQVDAANSHAIRISYEAVSEGSEYVAPVVLLEFGARSTGEPSVVLPVTCDAAAYLPTLEFPTATPRVMRAERTFWEKATAIHVACSGGKVRSGRFARHWSDIVQLDKAGHVQGALTDRSLAEEVTIHKTAVFAEKANGETIDYHVAVGGGLRLVPTGAALEALRNDYDAMVSDGLFLDEAEPFEVLMQQCGEIERRANEAAEISNGTRRR